MATYEEIYGKRVKEFDSDPTLDSSYEGQVWYDKSTGVLKSVVGFGAFASAPDAPISREGTGGSGGSISAAWVAGGNAPSPTSEGTTTTIEYDGSAWSSGGAMSNPRRATSGAGTLTAGLIVAGGDAPPFNNCITGFATPSK
jgi:hypothetical protein